MRKDVLGILGEHNSLNGLRLVTVEFALVAMAAGWICVGEWLHGDWLGAIAGMGILVNALVVAAVAVGQLRAGDENIGIVKAGSKAFRNRMARDYAGLGGHTLRIVVWVLVPFLLLGRLAWDRRFPHRKTM